MVSKKFSVIIVPKESGKMISGEFSQRTLALASALISIFILASIYFTIGFLKSNIDRKKMASLVTENRTLSAKVGSLESAVAMLKDDVTKIITQDENIRLVFDLPPVDPEIRQVGIGGESAETPTFSSKAEERAWMVEGDINKLDRQLNLENASFDDIYTKVQSKKEILDHTPTIQPCDGRFSRGYGMQRDPFTGLFQSHNGIDIAAPRGTPVYATAAGEVVFAGYQNDMGNYIRINHGNGIESCYGHLNKINVRTGQNVDRRDLIGFVGSTGYSTGPHLHYEVHEFSRAVNPNKYIIKLLLTGL